MEERFAIVFKGQICANVLLFEISLMASELSKATAVGSVVVNADPNYRVKTYIQGHSIMNNYKEKLVAECVGMAKNIIETMKIDI